MYSVTSTPNCPQVVVVANSNWPSNFKGRKRNANAYQNADILGEQTIELRLVYESFGRGRLAVTDLNTSSSPAYFSYLLAEILVKAGIISKCDIFKVQLVGRSTNARENFAKIVHKLNDGILTFEQAVVAVNHIHLTDSPLSEAMAIVHGTKTPLVCNTVIDFLKQAGVLTDEIINDLNLEQPVEPKSLPVYLMAAGVIDSDTLRNAISLRYLINKGELGLEQAVTCLQLCITHGGDAEEYLNIQV